MKEKILTFEEIDRLAVKIAGKMKNGGCLGLIGDLGTGKTTFTKGYVRNIIFTRI